MEFEIKRYFILVLPYVFATTLAALLLWGEDLKKYLRPLIIFSLVSSLTQTLTYQVHLESIRFLLEVATGYLVFWAVFRCSAGWNVRVYATSYVMGILILMITIPLLAFVGPYKGAALDQVNHNPSYWMIQNALLVPFAISLGWFGGRAKNKFSDLLILLRQQLSQMVLVAAAIGIQIVVFTGLLGQGVLYGSVSYQPTGIYYFLLFAIYLVSLIILVKFIQLIRRDITLSAQESVSESLLEMIVSMRGQRHDFTNHLQVISGLNQQHRYSELQDYVQQLVDEAAYYNEILKTENPIISALVNAKLGQARDKDIELKIDFQSDLSGLSRHSMDISRILGNLLDNAMEAVEHEEVVKEVRLQVHRDGPFVVIAVANPVRSGAEAPEKWVEAGFSTKGQSHSGIGLAISRQLARKINARLSGQVDEKGWAVFRLVLPTEPSQAGNEPVAAMMAQRSS